VEFEAEKDAGKKRDKYSDEFKRLFVPMLERRSANLYDQNFETKYLGNKTSALQSKLNDAFSLAPDAVEVAMRVMFPFLDSDEYVERLKGMDDTDVDELYKTILIEERKRSILDGSFEPKSVADIRIMDDVLTEEQRGSLWK